MLLSRFNQSVEAGELEADEWEVLVPPEQVFSTKPVGLAKLKRFVEEAETRHGETIYSIFKAYQRQSKQG